jgi:hypothetical protein
MPPLLAELLQEHETSDQGTWISLVTYISRQELLLDTLVLLLNQLRRPRSRLSLGVVAHTDASKYMPA